MMPTGYTHPVADGKITKFQDFALSCARAFGALITMRDDSMDAPIPKKIEPSDYHAKALIKAQAAHAKLLAMKPAQITAANNAAHQTKTDAATKYREEMLAQNANMEKMLTAAREWSPPTRDHAGMKTFMIEQLTSSLHDPKYFSEMPAPMSDADWHGRALAEAKRNVDYHTKENDAEIERANDRTEWLQQLRKSLKA